MSWPRALGLALGFAADRVLGDPQRGHPVALFGSAAAALERRTYADSRVAGVAHEALLVGGACALGAALEAAGVRRSRFGGMLSVVGTAAATFVVLGGTTLGREAEAVAARLAEPDLPGAREQVARIVGRNTASLTATEVARAAVETVAENTTDAVVAPLFWGALCGLPGLLGYRAVNTMDAMVGHKSPRYLRFGWAAARLDDAANWVPARLSALLVAAVRPRSASSVARIVARDAAQHPSPNAGQVESAFAAALGVRLGGANTYEGTVEDRGSLGDGREVMPSDIHAAVRLSKAVGLAAAACAALGALAVRRRRR
ncbi:MAG: cobalamin biosynthesis protein [Propionibacteriaceae bacterium]|nr:cobalamin biosynthesis protein [Propionibacteriaceae bacterium]